MAQTDAHIPTHTHTYNQVEAEMSNRYTRVGRGTEASCSWMQTSSHHRYVDYLSTSHTPFRRLPPFRKSKRLAERSRIVIGPPSVKQATPYPSLSRELTSALTIAISNVSDEV